MASKKRTGDAPRAPAHARGAATADAIVEAVGKVVAVRGLDGLTIRDVAKTAGVGMGSLYQFFPTREALLVAWHERILATEFISAASTLSLTSSELLGPSVIAKTMIDFARMVFQRIVEAQGPGAQIAPIARFAVRDQLASRLEDVLVSVLEHGTSIGRISVKRHRLAARLVIRAICYVTYDVALRPPMPKAEEDAYFDELAEMILVYLTRDAASVGGSENANGAEDGRRNGLGTKDERSE